MRLYERLIQKLVESARGRRILVPLSAGFDSRFIASGLREAGYGDVVCFAYGLLGNRDAVISRRVAERLGYPWHFVRYGNATMHRIFADQDCARNKKSADSLTDVHFPQDYHALDALIADGVAGPESIMVNGQSGDFITGNHVPAALVRREQDERGQPRSVQGAADAVRAADAVFMDKHAPKSSANSSLLASKSPDDATARTRPDPKGNGLEANDARCAHAIQVALAELARRR